jgi:hypothetical protein
MKAPVTLMLLVGFCAVVSPAVGQAHTSGADAVRNVDWASMRFGAPIPETLPTADSNDPVEAGFARQWLELLLQAPEHDQLVRETLKILSGPRNPNDQWSYDARAALRGLVRTAVPNGRNARVFCSDIGCLCYVERDVPPGHALYWTPIIYTKLKTGRGPEAPFGPRDTFDYVLHPSRTHRVAWELTIVGHSADLVPRSPVGELIVP